MHAYPCVVYVLVLIMFVYDLGSECVIKNLEVLKHNFMVCCVRDYYACGTYPVES